MTTLPKAILVASLALFLPNTPTSAEASGPSPNAVLDACIAGSNTTGAYKVLSGLDSSGEYARLASGSDISPNMVHAINDCAARHGGNLGAGYERTVSATLSTHSTSHHVIESPVPHRSKACPDWAPLIYRGNLYCFPKR